jgi:hypothetical protein
MKIRRLKKLQAEKTRSNRAWFPWEDIFYIDAEDDFNVPVRNDFSPVEIKRTTAAELWASSQKFPKAVP